VTGSSSEQPEISFADVAAEDPASSVAHETDAIEGDAENDPAAESQNDTASAEPTVSSLMSGGPVEDGDQLAP
jgi:hypothetical protein